MKALCYIAAFAVIAAILAASALFTDRRSVKTWAPNAIVAKPKPFDTAAIVLPKPDMATGAPNLDAENSAPAPKQAASGAAAPAATRSFTTVTDPEATGTLTKISPAPSHALRERRQGARPTRQASARQGIALIRPAPAPSSREPIQFRLAEGRN
ncbi:MAG: hypothetical protein ABW003_27900 [Microvirga sp.]